MQNASRKRKATSDDLRKKEKECRKLHQELGAVSTLIKDGAKASDCSECKRRKTKKQRYHNSQSEERKIPLGTKKKPQLKSTKLLKRGKTRATKL